MVEDYAKRAKEWRQEKDKFFSYAYDSPIPHETRHEFKGLTYYPYGHNFRVVAKLKRVKSDETIQMVTSKKTTQPYRKIGFLEFTIDGKNSKLAAYKRAWVNEDDKHIFIPFRDATSGKETYGAGRYLDIEEDEGDNYVLEFNNAYNPFCAYSEDYVCPLPPRENWLSVELRAGEKNHKSDHSFVIDENHALPP